MSVKVLAGLVGFVTLVVLAGPVPAQESEEPSDKRVAVGRSRRNAGVQFNLEGGAGTAEPVERAARPLVRRAAALRPPVYYATLPTFETLPDGTLCVRMIRRAYSSPLGVATAGDTQNILSTATADDYPPCPGTPRPATTAATEAASFWRVAGEDLLPKPDPRIAPGYMLAGKRAYLEARTVPAATFTHPTPLGRLTIEATSGKLYVDWGDGAGLRGPYDGPGAPWPDGTITHFWTDARTYDVRVQQRWTATWRLASGESGELDALTTEAVLEDFEVRELQAVRNR